VALRELLRRQIALLDEDRRPAIGEVARIGRLVVVDRERERHQDRRHPDGGELGDRDRAGAADRDVGLRVRLRHVLDERHQLRGDAGDGVARTQRVEVLRPGLVNDARALAGGQQRDRLRDALVQRRGAEAPADDEHAQGPGAPGEPLRRRSDARDRLAHRVPGRFRLRQCAGKRDQDPVRDADQHPVRETRYRVLLVDRERTAEESEPALPPEVPAPLVLTCAADMRVTWGELDEWLERS